MKFFTGHRNYLTPQTLYRPEELKPENLEKKFKPLISRLIKIDTSLPESGGTTLEPKRPTSTEWAVVGVKCSEPEADRAPVLPEEA